MRAAKSLARERSLLADTNGTDDNDSDDDGYSSLDGESYLDASETRSDSSINQSERDPARPASNTDIAKTRAMIMNNQLNFDDNQ